METNQDISNDPPLRKGGSRVRRYKPHSKRGCNTCKQVVRFPTAAMANGITTESGESSVGRSDLPVCVARERGGHVTGTSMDPMPDLTPQHPVQEPTMTTISPTQLFDNEQEYRSFVFFRDFSCSRLSYSFPSKFWEQILFQACHNEPAVRHAAVALGAQHERFMLGNKGLLDMQQPANISGTFPLEQYTKALRMLAPRLKDTSADVVLMASILFSYFESLRGHHASVASHIINSVKIIAELKATPNSKSNPSLSMSPISYMPLRDLSLLFVRLDVIDAEFRAMSTFQNGSSDLEGTYTAIEKKDFLLRFETLEQARRALHNIRIAAPRAAANSLESFNAFQPELYASSAEFSTGVKLRQYSKALDRFARINSKRLNKVEQAEIYNLKMQAMLVGMNLTTSIGTALQDDCGVLWFRWTFKCKEIVAHAESVVRSPETENQVQLTGIDKGIIWPLCFAAIRCHGSELERRAIELLRTKDRQEGVWNSFQAADAVETLFRSGEPGLGFLVEAEAVRPDTKT
ncbi:uncharacterized protein PAC_14287 [Phialocephala subalpina]|uniref:Uncharacterized protein n=1 Tax=Phialocephala subalpina TaxID=576137 RepID=A0A1L7XH65_9HELO|nr:uncharacterized protein PAC_14287 [Phialocephala subalpina]